METLRYLFRGKRKDNGEWAYGSLDIDNRGYAIKDGNEILTSSGIFYRIKSFEYKNACYHEVIPETVGQFTGLKDKNGMKIFEGNIAKYDYAGMVHCGVIFYESCAWKINCPASMGVIELDRILNVFITSIVVIGNIHDNPELLEGV